MLDPKIILSDPEAAAAAWTRLKLDGAALVAELTTMDGVRKAGIQGDDEKKHAQKECSTIFRDKTATTEQKAEARERLRPLSDELKTHEQERKDIRRGWVMTRIEWFTLWMNRDERERMGKAALVELVLRLPRPAKTSRTSSKPHTSGRKAKWEA